MAEPGLFQQTSGTAGMIVTNEQTPRQNPDRAFQYAHVLVKQHVRDLRGIKQRLDRRNQDCIIGADKLAQICSPACYRPPLHSASGALCCK